MAELAASAFAAMTSTFAASAGTAASIGGAAGSAAAGSLASLGTSALATGAATGATSLAAAAAPVSSTLAALQGAATIASMASTLVGGVMAYRQSEDQARFATLDAEGARLDGDERALRIRRETVQKIGAARVAYAGSGLDISGAGAIEDSLQDQSDFELGLTRDAAAYARSRGLAAAGQVRARGASGLIGAAGRALGTKLDYDVSIARRG